MTVRALSLFLCAFPLLALEHDVTFENTNFLMSYGGVLDNKRYTYDYNRFRVSDSITHEAWFVTLIGDLHNYLGHDYINSPDYTLKRSFGPDIAFSIETNTYDYYEGEAFLRLYRAYGGYADDVQTLSVGIQKISMGVGRIWTPTDLFNPKNSLALEPDEVFGVLALSYTRSITDLSNAMVVVSQREDKSAKYAGRVKGYLEVADIALDVVSSDDALMIGYEVEGNLFDTGAEWRSEGGYFKDDILEKEFFQGILGVDYGFENGLTTAIEWLYSSETFDYLTVLERESGVPDNLVLSHNYAGMTASYPFSLLLEGSLIVVGSFDDHSVFAGPLLEYSLGDDHSLALGAMLYGGGGATEFGMVDNAYYLRWKITF
jgi:hypothetical protein